jgi:hypothetical protein
MVRVEPCGVELDGVELDGVDRTSDAAASAETPIASGGDARTFIISTVNGWNIPHIGRQAVMVGHELAANALRHGAPPVRLRLSRRADTLVIEVSDRGDGTPQLVEIDNTTSPSGRGMRIVASLARDWGVDRHVVGKTVWAELAA